ncbi:hypothetical protein GF336_00855 [Candidatus Woesearchaeota archaeon]|nr:hypothetical protein [Candidatus Woesearchaeota archaeon]
MINKVACHAGKCWEEGKTNTGKVEEMFEDENIVEQIEKDLWKVNLYGN